MEKPEARDQSPRSKAVKNGPPCLAAEPGVQCRVNFGPLREALVRRRESMKVLVASLGLWPWPMPGPGSHFGAAPLIREMRLCLAILIAFNSVSIRFSLSTAS